MDTNAGLTTTKNLQIGIDIPISYITQKAAILGSTGSGKSYGAGSLIEEFLKNNMPFVLLDIPSAHFGLASKYNILVFGGDHGNELDLSSGKEMANQIKDQHAVIFDLSHYDDSDIQIFVAEFLREIFRIHTIERKPRHIFVEEAEVVFPQTNFSESKLSLLAGNRVMKRGRAFGLGMTLITQRPQDVNKKTLSQSQCTFILHLEGTQEVEVLNKMLRGEENKKELIYKVIRFKQGECLLYSPSWLGRIEVFKFRERETFHAGDTPELGKEKPIPPLNIIKVTQQKQVIEEQKPIDFKTIYKLGVLILILSIAAYLL